MNAIQDAVDAALNEHGIRAESEDLIAELVTELGRAPSEDEWRTACRLIAFDVDSWQWDARSEAEKREIVETADEMRAWRLPVSAAAESEAA